jgi:hypothetical protein
MTRIQSNPAEAWASLQLAVMEEVERLTTLALQLGPGKLLHSDILGVRDRLYSAAQSARAHAAGAIAPEPIVLTCGD